DIYWKEGFGTTATNPCVTGDTLVYVADGRGNVPIKKLAEEGKDVDVFCLNNNDKISIRKMRNPRITGYCQNIYKIKLDDGSVIRDTGNHKLQLKNGNVVCAKDLKYGDSLKIITRYEASIKEIFKEANSNSQDYFWLNNGFKNSKSEHKIICEHNIGRK